ncbi:hypothetical protein Chor_013369 [Crotalus horridus]
MEGLNPRSVLVTGCNRGIGLEMIKQLAEKSNPPQWIFATCRDPEGPRTQDLRNLVAQHQEIVIIPLKRLSGTGLHLLINNAAVGSTDSKLEFQTPEEMAEVYKTNVIGPMMISQAALNMLTRCQSLACSEDEILCVTLHPGWVITDMGGSTAEMTAESSVAAILNLLAHLSEKDSGTFLNWEGKVLPW